MSDQYIDRGVPLLRSQDVRPFQLATDDAKKISPEFHGRLRKSALIGGDVVVVRTGYPGTAAVVPPNIGELNCADLVVIRPGAELDPWFLAAYFNSGHGRALVGGQLVGAAQQHFNVGVAANMRPALPTLRSQRRIAAIVRSFAALIEINERRIELLEDLARSLYREWFVHFRFPGHEDVELVDSGLGPIPEGWKLKRLGDVALFVGGSAITKSSYTSEGFQAFSATGPDGYLRSFDVEGPGVVLSAVGARCGRTFRASGRWSAIANTIRYVPKPGLCGASWLYLSTSNPAIWPKRGSAQPFVSINDARGVITLAPSPSVTARFEELVGPTFANVDCLVRLNRQITKTRDLLLPRLVTGRLDISEIDLGVLTPLEVE